MKSKAPSDGEIAQRVASLIWRRIKLPKGFRRCEGHYLYGQCYRVNVIVECETGLIIGRSYFVVSDGDEIRSTDPMLEHA